MCFVFRTTNVSFTTAVSNPIVFSLIPRTFLIIRTTMPLSSNHFLDRYNHLVIRTSNRETPKSHYWQSSLENLISTRNGPIFLATRLVRFSANRRRPPRPHHYPLVTHVRLVHPKPPTPSANRTTPPSFPIPVNNKIALLKKK